MKKNEYKTVLTHCLSLFSIILRIIAKLKSFKLIFWFYNCILHLPTLKLEYSKPYKKPNIQGQINTKFSPSLCSFTLFCPWQTVWLLFQKMCKPFSDFLISSSGKQTDWDILGYLYIDSAQPCISYASGQVGISLDIFLAKRTSRDIILRCSFCQNDIQGYSEVSHYMSIPVYVGLSQDIPGCPLARISWCSLAPAEPAWPPESCAFCTRLARLKAAHL